MNKYPQKIIISFVLVIVFVARAKGEFNIQADSFNEQTPITAAYPSRSFSNDRFNFLMKRMLGLLRGDGKEHSGQKGAFEYLKSYRGQGLYTEDGTLFPIDKTGARVMEQEEKRKILLAVRSELAERGYRHGSSKSYVRGIGDGRRVTNIFYEVDIREALNEISEQTGVTIIADDTVQGMVNVKFENTPLERAMEMLMLSGGFTFKEMNGHYLVGFPQTDSNSFKYLSRTKLIRPVYMKPSEIASLLSDAYEPFVKVNNDNNTIVITASPRMMDRICADITVIDQKPAQIMLEALITDLTTEAKQNLGFDWWSTLDGTAMDMGTRIGGEKVNLTSSLGTGFRFFMDHPDDLAKNNFAINLHALVENGDAKIWATPRVVTVNGKKASITITSEQIFSIVAGPANYLQVETKELTAGVMLNITPQVASNGEICLTIHKAEVGTISKTGETGATGEKLPILTKRSVSTTVVVKNGETIVIGGLLEKRYEDKDRNLPGVSILGTAEKKNKTRDLVIFITSSILKEPFTDIEKEDYL